MKLDLVFNNSTADRKFDQNFFKNVLTKAAKELKLKGKVEVSVNLVGPAKIKSLNKKYRKKNKVTDVLSFPLAQHPLKKYDIMPVGDIFICPAFVKNWATRERADLQRQMRQLAVHGFLHLLGYDHEKSKKQALKMERLEKKILNKGAGKF